MLVRFVAVGVAVHLAVGLLVRVAGLLVEILNVGVFIDRVGGGSIHPIHRVIGGGRLIDRSGEDILVGPCLDGVDAIAKMVCIHDGCW